jgi:hypothetical protein
LQIIKPHLYVDAWDVRRAQEDITRAVDELAKKYEVTVNLTGGTKIMFLAARDAAKAAGVPMIYVNTEAGEIINFHSAGESRRPINVAIPIATQLRAAGRELGTSQRAEDIPKEKIAFLEWLVTEYEGAYQKCLKNVVIELRREARDHGGKSWGWDLTLKNLPPRGNGLEALKKLRSLGVLTFDEQKAQVHVTNHDSWDFLNGIWVELYALWTLHSSSRFDEVLGQVKVKAFKGELDVVVSKNGRLCIIECKTMGPGEGVASLAAKLRQHEILFGGTYARSLLALASDEHIGDIKPVAEQYGIPELIYGAALKKLPEVVERMVMA